MNLLVIGGTGFIGARVVRRLVREDHDVTVLHRGETETDLPDSVGHLYGDRAHPPDVDPARFDYAAEETALREGGRSRRPASG